MKDENVIFQIILHSGDARENIMKALQMLRNDDFNNAYKCIDEANLSLNLAHKVQSKCIFDEINNELNNVSLLMVHAQDHLMTTMAMRDFAKEIVILFETKIQSIK